VEHRTHHQMAGDPMKFLSLSDQIAIDEAELRSAPDTTNFLRSSRIEFLNPSSREESDDRK
jgi:hypothetical protein